MTHTRKDSGRKPPPVAVAFRRLAAAMRAGKTPQDLLNCINEVVTLLPGMESVRMDAGRTAVDFSDETLTVPLVGMSGALGALRLAPPAGGSFHAGQLQVAGAVADAISAVLEQFETAHSLASTVEVLETALGGLPVGIMCFRADGGSLFANARAAALLGGTTPKDWDSVWSTLAPESRRAPGQNFVLQDGLHLLHVVARRRDEHGPRAVVITDLAPQAVAFSEGLTVDILRNERSGQTLCLGVVTAPENSPDAIELVESLYADLPVGSRVGPLDAEAAAVIVHGVPAASLAALLREHCRARKLKGIRLGVAAFIRGKDDAERLLARAMARLHDVTEEPRPDVFVADRSAAVADALAVALRRDCRVVVSSPDESGLGILSEQPFDGVFLELPDPETPSAAGWVRRALELQPMARPFFVTEMPGPWDLAGLGLPEAPVFRKPFVVRDVRETIGRVLTAAD